MTTKRWVVIPTDGDAFIYSTDNDDTLTALQTLVGGLIDCVDTGRGVDMWVNDEGLYTKPLNLGASLLARRPIYGNAVLAGHDNAGNTVSLPEHADLWGLVGNRFTDAEAVDLLVEAMETRSMFMMVRDIADAEGKDPAATLASILTGGGGKAPAGVPRAAHDPCTAGYL